MRSESEDEQTNRHTHKKGAKEVGSSDDVIKFAFE